MSEKKIMKGNEAIAEAALAAGCRFYGGYPITPQTEILEYMSWRMEEVGGTFVQAESELAGINMVLGAAAAGARALTTSSGPGFTLKQEGISYLASCELPAVVVDVMRIGSGLGDVFQGQGDYWQLTRGGGHGDYRTIVLAPATVQECADIMSVAFDLAEKYTHPVLIASDAAIGQMMEVVEIPDFQEVNIDRFDWAIKGRNDGHPQRKIQNAYYTNPKYEQFLIDKYKRMTSEEQRYEMLNVEDAEIVFVAYGISSRMCMEAVEIGCERGLSIGLIRPITLFPFPQLAVERAENVKAFMSVEMNILGQMVDDIRLACHDNVPVYHYGTFYDIPEAEDILVEAEKILKEVSGR